MFDSSVVAEPCAPLALPWSTQGARTTSSVLVACTQDVAASCPSLGLTRAVRRQGQAYPRRCPLTWRRNEDFAWLTCSSPKTTPTFWSSSRTHSRAPDTASID